MIAGPIIPTDNFYGYHVLGWSKRCLDFFNNHPTSYPKDNVCLYSFCRVLDDMENERPFSLSVNPVRSQTFVVKEEYKFKHRRPVWQAIADASSEVFRITFDDQKECATSLKDRLRLFLKYLAVYDWIERSRSEINSAGLTFMVQGETPTENKEIAITIICHPHLTGEVTAELLQHFFTDLVSRLEELVKQK